MNNITVSIRKKRWAELFALGQEITQKKGLIAEDVSTQIKAYRKSKAPRR